MRTPLIASLLAAVSLAACAAPELPPRVAGVSVPLTIIRDVHPVASVSVNGGPEQPVLLDTGVTATILPEGTPTSAQLCFKGGQPCADTIRSYYHDNDYNRAPKNGSYAGLVGMDILGQTYVEFDYLRDTLTWGGTPDPSAPWVTTYLDKRTQRPHAAVTANGVKMGNLLVDTGASYTRLKPAQFEKLPQGSYRLLGHETGFPVKGPEDSELYIVDEICIIRPQPVCQKDAIVQMGRWAAIGSSFLRDFHAGFDTQAGKLYLQPQDAPRAIDSVIFRWGFQLDLRNGNGVIRVEGDPARAAGLNAGDRLTAVNGTPMTGYLELHDTLEADGLRQATLEVITAGGQVKTVVLTR